MKAVFEPKAIASWAPMLPGEIGLMSAIWCVPPAVPSEVHGSKFTPSVAPVNRILSPKAVTLRADRPVSTRWEPAAVPSDTQRADPLDVATVK